MNIETACKILQVSFPTWHDLYSWLDGFSPAERARKLQQIENAEKAARRAA
jgi:hypothetical protein